MMPWKKFITLWGKIALQSFGGPAGQMAVMHQYVVEEEKLVSEQEFLAALNFCMLLPGPEAQQLATYLGRKTHGTLGGLLSGGLFILPGFFTILALSFLYLNGAESIIISGLFYGLKPAVIALVAHALIRIGKKTLHSPLSWALASCAFFALLVFNAPFPLVLLVAAIVGLTFSQSTETGPLTLPPLKQTLLTASIWLFIWLTPLLALWLCLGSDHVLTQLAVFFSKLSLMSFGGAYAALTYLAQQAVEVYHWVTPTQMLDGLATAETTPGPLILVVQFVGFIAAGVSGSLVAVWMTFAPCFLWIFTFAPYLQALEKAARWQSMLKGITAAVVGVIAHLSLWFLWQTVLPDEGFDYLSILIMAVALILQFVTLARWWVILLTCSLLGIGAMFF